MFGSFVLSLQPSAVQNEMCAQVTSRANFHPDICFSVHAKGF
jgi:hypothetical protein